MLAYESYSKSFEASTIPFWPEMDRDVRGFYLRMVEDVFIVAMGARRPLYVAGVSRSLRNALAAGAGQVNVWRQFHRRVSSLLARCGEDARSALDGYRYEAFERLAQFVRENIDLTVS